MPSGVVIGSAEYEWIQAAHSDGMSYDEFSGMPVEYQELIIAAYRTQGQIESVKAFANRPKKK